MRISDWSSDVCSSELSAALASAAWVTTPVDSDATSGTRLASAWAETESSVASLAETAGGWVWALAVMVMVMVMQVRARALASASGRKGLRVMGGSVMDEVRVGTIPGTGREPERGLRAPDRGWPRPAGYPSLLLPLAPQPPPRRHPPGGPRPQPA